MSLTAATPRSVLAAAFAAAVLGPLARLPWLAQWRTGGHLVLRLKTTNILPGEMALDQLLDTIELLDFIGADQ